MPLEEFRLRGQARARGCTYEELREEVTRSVVEAARKKAARRGAQLTWGSAVIERQYASAMGIDGADLFHRWDFDGKVLTGSDASSRASEQSTADPFAALVTGRVGGKVMDEIRKSCRPGETPAFIVGEGMAGGLVAFSDRCMIIKKGALAGLMSGSVGGGRTATFMYADVTGIEYNSGWVNGVLEILTPSYQGSANKDFWRGSGKGRNADSNDPWTLSNTLPLTKSLYEQARRKIDRMRQMIADIKHPPAVTAAPITAPAPAADLPEQLARLAALHDSGVLDDDEFRQAKQALITKNS